MSPRIITIEEQIKNLQVSLDEYIDKENEASYDLHYYNKLIEFTKMEISKLKRYKPEDEEQCYPCTD